MPTSNGAGIHKDVLVWSTSDLSAAPSLGSSFTVIGTPDLMSFKDDEGVVQPGDFVSGDPNTVEPNQTLSGTLEGQQFRGNHGSTDVFEFEIAFQVTDGVNTFNVYQIDNDEYGGTTTAYVSEFVLEPGTTYSVINQDNSVNSADGGYEATPSWTDLAGQVDGTSGNDVIGAGFVDDDSDQIGGSDGNSDYIVGEGGGDTITSGVGDDLIYGDHIDDIPAGTTEYIAQGFVRDLNFELESGSLAFTNPTVSISGTPIEIRFIDNDGVLNGDTASSETPDDLDQLVEINGTLFKYSADYLLQFNGSDGKVYDILVIDVDRNDNGVIGLDDPSSDPGDVDYENGQILIPRGDVPPPGVTLTAFGPDYDLVSENYSALNGAAVVTNYNDSIDAGDGSDTVFGGQGDDTIAGGTGADTVSGGTGSDTFKLGDSYGNDSITGGEDGDGLDVDVIDASGVTADGVDVVLSGNESGTITSTEGTATFSEIESFTLTGQDDTFNGNFATNDITVDSGAGNDTLTGGAGNNTLVGGTGDDLFNVGYGNDNIAGGDGTDTLSIDQANDVINLTFSGDGAGSFSDDDGDSGTFTGIEAVEGSAGNDTINASADSLGVSLSGMGGNDALTGGSGGDTLDGGAGIDTLTGGAGADVFIADGTADTITDFDTTTGIGNGSSADNDFVDLSGYYNQANLDAWNAANPGNTYKNPLQWMRADQADNGTLDQAGGLRVQNSGSAVSASEMNAENTGVVCFASGTLIRTLRGEVAIERLKVGDVVITRDNGPQQILWAGRKTLTSDMLARAPKLKPIRLSARFYGLDRDLIVSPQHGILLRDPERGGTERFYRATHLADLEGGAARRMLGCRQVTYHHLMFGNHQTICANGMWSESFYPGKMALSCMPDASVQEVISLFPELQHRSVKVSYGDPAIHYARRRVLPDTLRALSRAA